MHASTARTSVPGAAPVPESLAARFAAVRQASLALAEGLSDADAAVQSMPDASPVKWHLAHTTWFFETFVLEPHEPSFAPHHPAYRVLFNSYYEAVGERHPRPERGMITRPGLAEVIDYRKAVDRRISALLAGPAAGVDAVAAIVELGLQHEQQHQELILTDLKNLLGCNPLRPQYRAATGAVLVADVAPRRDAEWIAHPGGVQAIGFDGQGFSFDNEGLRHRVWVEPFELAAWPVSNAEYCRFIEDGGYRRPDLWMSLGWDVVRSRGWTAPAYWSTDDDGQRTSFTLHGECRLDPDAPVCHLSWFEADAYARWAGARLPTEAEWELVAVASAQPGAVAGPRRSDGTTAAAAAAAAGRGDFAATDRSFDPGMLHPAPPRLARADGRPGQLTGEVWQWTASPYQPYPGFRPAAGAIGEYNGKFMCSQYVLRGGSCVTPQGHTRPTYRNFFPPDARWQFSGLRLARER